MILFRPHHWAIGKEVGPSSGELVDLVGQKADRVFRKEWCGAGAAGLEREWLLWGPVGRVLVLPRCSPTSELYEACLCVANDTAGFIEGGPALAPALLCCLLGFASGGGIEYSGLRSQCHERVCISCQLAVDPAPQSVVY